MSEDKPLVGVLMGSRSDWETMKGASETLARFGVPHECRGLSAPLPPVQRPAGIPVGTLAIGKPGATNAALLAVAILAAKRPELRLRLRAFPEEQAAKVLKAALPCG